MMSSSYDINKLSQKIETLIRLEKSFNQFVVGVIKIENLTWTICSFGWDEHMRKVNAGKWKMDNLILLWYWGYMLDPI